MSVAVNPCNLPVSSNPFAAAFFFIRIFMAKPTENSNEKKEQMRLAKQDWGLSLMKGITVLTFRNNVVLHFVYRRI